ncbi:SDR family NAD(P)-dependent oxidoreductase [Vibrio nigripulchritudo]|uniref:SDR family NAD(P)-dependent oxidoreductase n=1 Tax=Vibrio nigripulchritudo TaxID=28173 RepID=UPI0005F9CA2B|nr:SDR family NAD(P)-dependent oxidoreductase [Vibrio nigripulchritudo]KJY75888.1 3-oxoacyl-ACP reductase [Vibrio nigripulchritudo]
MTAHYPDLRNKHVLITGGATGIGQALTSAFDQQKCKVSFLDINTKAGQQLEGTLNTARFASVDIRDLTALEIAIKDFEIEFGPVDVLINNAANDKRHALPDLNESDWNELMNVNLRSYFYTAQYVHEKMKSNGGSIINLSSISHLLGISGYPAYSTAKAAIHGLTKSLARELGEWDIRVNTLTLGWVVTEKQKQLWLTEQIEKEWLEQQCLKKMVQPQDIANAALFLASNASSMITGQSLVIDGGRT